MCTGLYRARRSRRPDLCVGIRTDPRRVRWTRLVAGLGAGRPSAGPVFPPSILKAGRYKHAEANAEKAVLFTCQVRARGARRCALLRLRSRAHDARCGASNDYKWPSPSFGYFLGEARPGGPRRWLLAIPISLHFVDILLFRTCTWSTLYWLLRLTRTRHMASAVSYAT